MLLLHTLNTWGSHVTSYIIPPSGLGGDVMNRWTDIQMDGKIMLRSHTLTMEGSHVASLV